MWSEDRICRFRECMQVGMYVEIVGDEVEIIISLCQDFKEFRNFVKKIKFYLVRNKEYIIVFLFLRRMCYKFILFGQFVYVVRNYNLYEISYSICG